MRSARELLTLQRLHFPQVLLMLLVLLFVALVVAFGSDLRALWFRPWVSSE